MNLPKRAWRSAIGIFQTQEDAVRRRDNCSVQDSRASGAGHICPPEGVDAAGVNTSGGNLPGLIAAGHAD
jgi:hypothetical protein